MIWHTHPTRPGGGLLHDSDTLLGMVAATSWKSLISVLCLWVSVTLMGCNESKVEQSPPSAMAEKESGKTVPEPPKATPPRETTEPHRLTVPPEALAGTTFQTATVTRQPFNDEVQATGTIKPNEYRLTHVTPRIAGRAIQVLVELGDAVKSGQSLALLDSLELGQKKSEFLQARTSRDVDARNYEREKGLFEQRISSEKEFLEAKGTFEKSVAAYQAAHEALRLIGLSEADIKKITWSDKGKPLSYFPLLAPQEGTITERHITRGEVLAPQDKAFTIADLSTVWILVDIYEQHLAAVRVGSDVTITVDAYPGETFHGKIAYLSYVLNPDTRTVDARVEIANPARRLRPGMFARASLTLPGRDQDRTALVVPQDAIHRIDEKPVAFVEEQPGTYSVRFIVEGRQSSRDVEVRSGLTEGERVVTQGSFYLKSMLLKERIEGG